MIVAYFSCPVCGDEWQTPNPREPRDTCRECGAALNVELKEVA